ncbi:MAG TPA: hypothetical protein VK253_05195, partial [Candidatus Binatia bacterium]|nr:hypothetical protein [Candidatus Binatia bacterium]
MLTSKSYSKASASSLILLFILGLLVGGLLLFYVSYLQITHLNSEITSLQSQVSNATGFQNATYQTIT